MKSRLALLAVAGLALAPARALVLTDPIVDQWDITGVAKQKTVENGLVENEIYLWADDYEFLDGNAVTASDVIGTWKRKKNTYSVDFSNALKIITLIEDPGAKVKAKYKLSKIHVDSLEMSGKLAAKLSVKLPGLKSTTTVKASLEGTRV